MAGTSFHKQQQVRLWLGLYIEDNGITSLRVISAWLSEKINETISPSTISRLLKERGYQIKKGEWVKK